MHCAQHREGNAKACPHVRKMSPKADRVRPDCQRSWGTATQFGKFRSELGKPPQATRRCSLRERLARARKWWRTFCMPPAVASMDHSPQSIVQRYLQSYSKANCLVMKK